MVFHIFLDPCDQHGAKGHFPGDFQFALTFFITLHCCDTVHMQSRTSETDLLSVNANQSIHIKIKESSEKNPPWHAFCDTPTVSDREGLQRQQYLTSFRLYLTLKEQYVSIPYKT